MLRGRPLAKCHDPDTDPAKLHELESSTDRANSSFMAECCPHPSFIQSASHRRS